WIDGERLPCQHRRASGASVGAVTEKRTEAGHDVLKLSGTAFLEGRRSRSCPARGVFQVACETARRIEVGAARKGPQDVAVTREGSLERCHRGALGDGRLWGIRSGPQFFGLAHCA